MYLYVFMLLCLTAGLIPVHLYGQNPLTMIIMGYGGRAQWLLMRCLEEKKDIVIAAICDDHAQQCLEHMRQECKGIYHSLKNTYDSATAHTELYPDTPEGLQAMLQKYKDVDLIWVTSRNDRHFDHLTNALKYSSCKKIFMEKPLFRTLAEWQSFDPSLAHDKEILIGLTLRYSSMAVIVVQELQSRKKQLGALHEVKAWEKLGFSHALTAFVLGSRHDRNLWGGLLLEKSIHDLDLALFFITSLGLNPSQIVLNTTVDNQFFTRSNLPQILNYCENDSALKKRVLDVLGSYPFSGQFRGSHLIPDYHKLSAHLYAADTEPVKLEIETDMSSYRPVMERGINMTFEHGTVLVDVMASCMTISLNDGTISTHELNTLHGGHADGDMYVVRSILQDERGSSHFRSTIFDPVVQLATVMALISEEQALYQKGTEEIHRINDVWIRNLSQ